MKRNPKAWPWINKLEPWTPWWKIWLFYCRKSILKALRQNKSKENFSNIKNKFILTSSKAGTKLKHLNGERWQASAALGYVMGRQIFYAPYNTSQFYYHMCQSGLLKALRELTDAGAIVLLPVGSDEFIKYIADLCIYIQTPHYDIESLRQKYNGLINAGDWIHFFPCKVDRIQKFVDILNENYA